MHSTGIQAVRACHISQQRCLMEWGITSAEIVMNNLTNRQEKDVSCGLVSNGCSV